MQLTTIGLDIATNSFPAYGVDAHGKKVVVSQSLSHKQALPFFASVLPA